MSGDDLAHGTVGAEMDDLGPGRLEGTTDEVDGAHVTVGLGIVAPRASVTVGTTVAVSPSDVNDRLVGANATAAAT